MNDKKKGCLLQLVGKTICFVPINEKEKRNIKGTVIDETKNTIIITENNNNKIYEKKNIIIFHENNKIRGEYLIGKIHDRIKNK